MKASGTPKTKNKTQAVRRARALRGNLRFGPLGSFQAGRGRFRELAITMPGGLGWASIKTTARVSETISAQRPPERPCGPNFPADSDKSLSSERVVKRLSHLRSYLLTGTDGRSRDSLRARG